jgi:peptide/nickel transport system ATP-binding protein
MSSQRTVTKSDEARTDQEPILEVRNVRKYFEETNGLFDRFFGASDPVRAVDGVSFDLYPGETMAIVGESGCGKSTLAKTILNLHDVSDGEIQFQGDTISGLSDRAMREYRQSIQMIYQDPLASLNPRQSVEEILLAPMEVHDLLGGRDQRLQRARDLLERVGLSADYLPRYPHEFSGGQQQRIGIARALTLEPDLLIADEPTSALDVSVQAQIVNLLDDIQSEFDLSIIFITHDLSVVQHVADRVGVMYLGELVETAPTAELYENPGHPYTVSLLSAIPRIAEGDGTERVVLKGPVPSPSDPPSGCRFHTRCPVVIPPESWDGSENAFVNAFRYYQAVKQGQIDIDDVETRLELEDEAKGTTEIATYIRGQYFEDPRNYPEQARDAILSSTRALAREDTEIALDILEDVFQSPCETDVPETTSLWGAHETRCHRTDPDYDAPSVHRGDDVDLNSFSASD